MKWKLVKSIFHKLNMDYLNVNYFLPENMFAASIFIHSLQHLLKRCLVPWFVATYTQTPTSKIKYIFSHIFLFTDKVFAYCTT